VFVRNLSSGLDNFSHIASPANLTSYPRYIPAIGNLYFLDNSVELEFDTVKEREDTISLIVLDVNKLKKDWELVKDNMTTTYTVII